MELEDDELAGKPLFGGLLRNEVDGLSICPQMNVQVLRGLNRPAGMPCMLDSAMACCTGGWVLL